MTYIAMSITGITMEKDSYIPLVILKDSETDASFPLRIKEDERSIILNSIMRRGNLYSGILKQLIWQQNIKIAKIALEETEESELVSIVYLSHNSISDKIFLYPSEGILLAVEFSLEIHVVQNLLKSRKYFKSTIDDTDLVNHIEHFFSEAVSSLSRNSLRGKKDTLQ